MLIENPKTYKGNEVETIFFRPTFCGKGAEELGIRVIYNMPLPTTVQVWSRPESVLQPYESGWSGGEGSTKLQKKINMSKVKAENSFSAEEYFSMIFEQITNSSEVSLQDLSGTDLEAAETKLFREAIAEGIRTTMWIGDTEGQISDFETFDGLIKAIHTSASNGGEVFDYTYTPTNETTAHSLLDKAWKGASQELKSLRSEGQLAFFMTSDLVMLFEDELDNMGTEAAYRESIEGRPSLYYRGIPIVEVPLGKYDEQHFSYRQFCLLTDRRNLVLALNTKDMPENEVRMWYNPDEMENRQRAVFLAGTEILDDNLISCVHTR